MAILSLAKRSSKPDDSYLGNESIQYQETIRELRAEMVELKEIFEEKEKSVKESRFDKDERKDKRSYCEINGLRGLSDPAELASDFGGIDVELDELRPD